MQSFLVNGAVPGTLWNTHPDGPLVLIAHGGGQHRGAPAVTGRAALLVAAGFRVAALDAPGHGDRTASPSDRATSPLEGAGSAPPGPGGELAERITRVSAEVAELAVPEWRAALDLLAPDGPAGFWGVSLGGAIGLALMAAEPRITAGVLGLATITHDRAARITAPIEFAIQGDDEFIPREAGLSLYDALGSTQKSLHINPGRHADLPRFEAHSGVRFFTRHLKDAT